MVAGTFTKFVSLLAGLSGLRGGGGGGGGGSQTGITPREEKGWGREGEGWGRAIKISDRGWNVDFAVGVKGGHPPFTDPDLVALSNDLDLWMAQPEEDVTHIPPRLRQVLNALRDNGTSDPYHHNNQQHREQPPQLPQPQQLHHNRNTKGNRNNNNNNKDKDMNNHRKRQTQAGDANKNDGGVGNFAVDRVFEGESICGACTLLAKLVVGYLRLGAPVDFMANVLVKICYVVAYNSIPVCRGIIFQDTDRLAWIVRHSAVNGDEVCAMLLGDRGCGRFDRRPWKVHLPPPLRKRPQPYRPHRRSLTRLPPSLPRFDQVQEYVKNEETDRIQRDIHLSSTSSPSSSSSLSSYTTTSTSSLPSSPQSFFHTTTSSSPSSPPSPQSFYHITTTTTTSSDSPSPRRISASSSSSNTYGRKGKRKEVLKVLHLTDPHYDPDYVAGSNAVCEAPLCCNRDSGTPAHEGHRAGRWGDYRNCDSPKWLLHNMFQHIVTNHPDIDYVVCTGDLVPHHIWKVSKEGNLAVVREMANLVRGFFPNIPIYGAVGNHESFPRDSFPPPEVEEVWAKFGSQWLYDALSDHWGRMAGQPMPPTARFGGFYSTLVRPGFRIISINTNYCYRLNWWVLYKDVDPGLMIGWLVMELTLAEQRGELVHIIGHVPPLYIDCYAQWGHQFDRVVSRFSHIIKGQFYGHSHMDDIRIHYDMADPGKAVGVEYITPNNGPFSNLNPSYRIFYIDGDHEETTRDVLDYETWVMNLTHANAFDAPYWYRLYTARQDLQLPSLHPRHWDRLAHRMMDQPRLFDKFRRYQVQDSDAELTKGCNAACRQKTVCSIINGNRVKPFSCRPSS